MRLLSKSFICAAFFFGILDYVGHNRKQRSHVCYSRLFSMLREELESNGNRKEKLDEGDTVIALGIGVLLE